MTDTFCPPAGTLTGKDGTMAAGDWASGYQAIAQAPMAEVPAERSRYIGGHRINLP